MTNWIEIFWERDEQLSLVWLVLFGNFTFSEDADAEWKLQKQ